MTTWILVVGSGLVPAVFFFAAWRAARNRAEITEQSVRNLRDVLALERADMHRWMALARERERALELLRGKKP